MGLGSNGWLQPSQGSLPVERAQAIASQSEVSPKVEKTKGATTPMHTAESQSNRNMVSRCVVYMEYRTTEDLYLLLCCLRSCLLEAVWEMSLLKKNCYARLFRDMSARRGEEMVSSNLGLKWLFIATESCHIKKDKGFAFLCEKKNTKQWSFCFS
jgi:hypothetical protein